MRAAIYARTSTDKQSEASPTDQVNECRRFAERQGFVIVEHLVFEEAGISGASRHNRPRLLELVARIDEWDVLLAYDFSRLARNQEDLGWIRNRLRSYQRRAFDASSGLDLDNIGSRVMGVMNEEYRERIRLDTHRGLRGRFDRGLATGGCPFGYRTVPIVVGNDAHGRPMNEGYRIEVVPELAALVRRLFEGYALVGLGLRTLAHQFNAAGHPPPRGHGQRRGRKPRDPARAASSWSPSAIREILRNPMYRGERVWNRSKWVKEHDTGRRRRIERHEGEWVRQQEEAWRIVTDELWAAAQEARGRRNERCTREKGSGKITWHAAGLGTVRKRLLAGFLSCGECGGSFHAINATSWGCSWHRDRGNCGNALLVPGGHLERTVVAAVAAALDEDLAKQAVKVALEELAARLAKTDRTVLEAKLAAIDAKLERALDMAIELPDLAVVKGKLRELRAEREKAVRELARAGKALPTLEELEPRVTARLRDLRETLTADVGIGRMALGALLGEDRVRVYADGRIEGTATLQPETLWAPRKAPEPKAVVVAGARFEPVSEAMGGRAPAR